jgi:hypothetical protein
LNNNKYGMSPVKFKDIESIESLKYYINNLPKVCNIVCEFSFVESANEMVESLKIIEESLT